MAKLLRCRTLYTGLAILCGCGALQQPLDILLPALLNRPQRVEADFNVPYAERDGEELLYDFYRPADANGPLPLVIFTHGGFWVMGSRVSMTAFAYDLAAQGYATASIDFRLANAETNFPMPVADILTAIRYFRKNAEALRIDPQRIALYGLSSGAHMALLAGMTDDTSVFDPNLPPGESADVRAIVNLFGPTDFTADQSEVAQWQVNFVEYFLGESIDLTPELARQASSVTYARPDGPPVLTIHGTRDKIVPVSQGRLLAIALDQAGQPYIYVEIPGMTHSSGSDWQSADAQTYRQTVFDFLAENLKGD